MTKKNLSDYTSPTYITLAQVVYNLTMTYGGYTHPSLSHRYIVGTASLYMGECRKVALATIVKALKDDTLFGTWYSLGTIHIDMIKGYDDLTQALSKAKEFKQIAIYDTVERKVLPV